MEKILLIGAQIFLSVLSSAIICAVLSFIIETVIGTTDCTPDKLTLIGALLGAFAGIIIGLIVGIGNLGAVGGGIVGFSAALILTALEIHLMTEANRKYEIFSTLTKITFMVYVPSATLAGIIPVLLNSLLFKTRT